MISTVSSSLIYRSGFKKESKRIVYLSRKYSMTVLEIGAGYSQPYARELGEERFLDDSVRTALVRVNID